MSNEIAGDLVVSEEVIADDTTETQIADESETEGDVE